MEVKLIKTDCPIYRKQKAMFIKKKKLKGHRWKIRGWKNLRFCQIQTKRKRNNR